MHSGIRGKSVARVSSIALVSAMYRFAMSGFCSERYSKLCSILSRLVVRYWAR